jgi:hypothetical protein
MRAAERGMFPRRGDGWRLLALGRVPRCERCPRYRALNEARALPGRPRAALPQVPRFCSYQLCAPLATRYGSVAASPRPVAAHEPLRTARS